VLGALVERQLGHAALCNARVHAVVVEGEAARQRRVRKRCAANE
jgi:hypothetical protein